MEEYFDGAVDFKNLLNSINKGPEENVFVLFLRGMIRKVQLSRTHYVVTPPNICLSVIACQDIMANLEVLLHNNE